MLSISIPLAQVAFVPHGRIDWITVVLGLAAFAVLTFWKWRIERRRRSAGGRRPRTGPRFPTRPVGGPLS